MKRTQDIKALFIGLVISLLYILFFARGLTGTYQQNSAGSDTEIPVINAVTKADATAEQIAALFGLEPQRLADANTVGLPEEDKTEFGVMVLAIHQQSTSYSAVLMLTQGKNVTYKNVKPGDTVENLQITTITSNKVTITQNEQEKNYFLFSPIQDVGVE